MHCEDQIFFVCLFFIFCLYLKGKEGKEKQNYPAFLVTLIVSLKIQKLLQQFCNKIILHVQAKIKQTFSAIRI